MLGLGLHERRDVGVAWLLKRLDWLLGVMAVLVLWLHLLVMHLLLGWMLRWLMVLVEGLVMRHWLLHLLMLLVATVRSVLILVLVRMVLLLLRMLLLVWLVVCVHSLRSVLHGRRGGHILVLPYHPL